MTTNKQAVIISAARTPTGRFQGLLKGFSAPELGAIAIKEAVKRAGISGNQVDEVIMGCVVQAGIGQAPARQASIAGRDGIMRLGVAIDAGKSAIRRASVPDARSSGEWVRRAFNQN